jgi:hypothetical protein
MFRFFRRDRRMRIANAQLAERLRDMPSRYVMLELHDRLIDQNDRITDVDDEWKSLTPGQRMLYVLAQFDAEVVNGGVEQFFWNCPERIFEVHEALEKLGEARLVAAYEEVLDQLAEEQESWLDLRERFGSGDGEKLGLFIESRDLLEVDDFDDAWYGEWDGHGTQLADGLGDLLGQRMTQWVLEHPQEFCTGKG